MSTYPSRFPFGVRICHVPACTDAPGDGGFCEVHQAQLDARVAAHVQRETDPRDLAELLTYPWHRVEAAGRYHLEVHPSADGWTWYVVTTGGDRLFGRRTPGPVLDELTRLSGL